MSKVWILMSVFLIPVAHADTGESWNLNIESGFLGVYNHRIQFSEDNTKFDYVEDGGQSNLFSLQRYSLDVVYPQQGLLRLVYQPIDLQTQVTLDESIKIDNEEFVAGTPMDLRYSFPYYRATWLWETVNQGDFALHLGLGIQIRNATIEFKDGPGDKSVINRDVGPVPLFALMSHYNLAEAWQLRFEAEGNYANTAFINGDDENKVRGAILDSAVSLHKRLSDKISVFSSLRYLTGGAEGNSEDPDTKSGDGFTSNWIDAHSFTLGVTGHLENW